MPELPIARIGHRRRSQPLASHTTATPEARAEVRVTAAGPPRPVAGWAPRADPVAAGSKLQYRLRVRNKGSATATGVEIRDLLPPEGCRTQLDGNRGREDVTVGQPPIRHDVLPSSQG